jgi:pimeloyl-ACP methyl ester carboxylesterase
MWREGVSPRQLQGLAHLPIPGHNGGMIAPTPLTVFAHGRTGPLVVALHGGPGAPGSAAAWARPLASTCRVLEPLQRASGAEPLTVARHVADLHELIARRAGETPVLVGHSWGAMLALAYAAAHPKQVSALVLVGCGTFDLPTRERLRVERESRMIAGLRQRLTKLTQLKGDPDERLRRIAELMLAVDSEDLVPGPWDIGAMDARAHDETWADMLRLQDDGTYPAAFAAIDCPVLMLHGMQDPHPGPLIRAGLARYIRRLEYVSLPRCGHTPWLENGARTEFFDILRSWIGRRSAAQAEARAV